MHYLAWLAGFRDQRHLGSGFLPHEQIVNGRKGKQARNGSVIFVDAAVGQDHQRVSGFHRQRGALAQLIEGTFQSGFALLSPEESRQRGGQQVAVRYPAQFLQFAIREQRMCQLQHVTVLWRFL